MSDAIGPGDWVEFLGVPEGYVNLEKAVSDALQAAGVIRDDCDAESIFVAWSASAPDRNGGVSITLEAA